MVSISDIFDNWKSRWITTILEVYILRSIVIQERYGGELVSLSQENIDDGIRVPTVYAMLKRHVRDGVLEVVEQRDKEGVTRGTSRKYYQLTKNGTTYLEKMEKEINSFADTISRLTQERKL